MKRIIIVRHGEFSDEGKSKGHLSNLGRLQMEVIAKHIKKGGPVDNPILYIQAPTLLIRESMECLLKNLAMNGELKEEESWKPGLLEKDEEKKQAINKLLAFTENHDCVVIITNGKNIAVLPQFLASHPKFKGYEIKSETLAETEEESKLLDSGFGLNFTGAKFGFEARWGIEVSGLVLEEIFAPI